MSVATPLRPTQPQTTARLGFSLDQTFTQPEAEPAPPVLPATPRTGPWIAVALPVSAFGVFAVTARRRSSAARSGACSGSW